MKGKLMLEREDNDLKGTSRRYHKLVHCQNIARTESKKVSSGRTWANEVARAFHWGGQQTSSSWNLCSKRPDG